MMSCMCVVNKQYEFLEVVSESLMMRFSTSTAGSVCLCGVSSPVVVLGLFVRLS